EEVKSHNSKFVIVTLTNGVQVKPENKADLNYPERRIGKLGESINVPVITLAPKFLTYAKTNNTYLHGFDDSGEGHWNVEGNRLAGELIAKEMCNILY
ncbi:TPA: G-D-S-L family lipolytic protein, partial [Candidatus Peribacteria bacterium]|nr:G-D-S-L family lipolytic protein [Candidatus Peribacteria bacterium]